MHKILFYKFMKCLYMFRALCAHHQEAKLYYTASGIVTPVGGRPVHRLGALNLCTASSWLITKINILSAQSAKHQNLHLDTPFLQNFDASRLDTRSNISEDHTINTTLPETLSALTSIYI